MTLYLQWLKTGQGEALAARMTLRDDMAAQFADGSRTLPEGPKWALLDGERPFALGGLEPAGAGRSTAWLLVEDLTIHEWAIVRRALRGGLAWARTRSIKQIFALVAGDQPRHAAMLARLGFRLTGQEGDDAVMMKDLT